MTMFSFRKKNVNNESIFDKQLNDVGIFLKDTSRLLQIGIIGLTEQDLYLVRSVKTHIEVRIKDIVEEFYATIESVPEFQNIITEHSTSERLRQTLRHHIVEMLEGHIDDMYIEKRKRVAYMHVRIGLDTKWYLAGFQKLEKTVRQVVSSLELSKEQMEAIFEAVSKICNFEQQIVLEEYERVASEIVEQQQNKVKQDVREIIGGISKNLDRQSQETSSFVSGLIDNTEEVNEQLTNSMNEARATQEASKSGYTQMKRLSEQTHEINDRTVQMTGMVQELDQSSSEIQAVVEIVKGIANQTNLLAWNSAIEAARAGEHGKGFAVVADEVRKLADQTKKSVEQIAVLIGGSSTVTAQVIDSIHQIQRLVEEGMEQNEESLAAFENISRSIQTTIKDFEEVANKVLHLSTVATQIGESSERLEEASATLQQTIETF